MLQKTKAIVLHNLRYNDHSVIVTMYSAHFGRIAFMVTIPGKSKSNSKMGLFQPLSILELEADYKSQRTLHRLKDARILFPFATIPFDLKKRAIAFYISELLYRVVKEEASDTRLFDFISNTLQILDLTSNDYAVANFHLLFVLQLSQYLGFYPEKEFTGEDNFFDLVKGSFSVQVPGHDHFLDRELTQILKKLMGSNFENLHLLRMDRLRRRKMIEKLTEYYHIHMEGMSKMNSLEILEQILD
jgi:DNA repair protein RecO (recombination protein O)